MALDQSLFNDRVLLSVGYMWTRYRKSHPGGVRSLVAVATSPCSALPHQNFGQARAEGIEASAKVKLIRDQPWIKSLDLQMQYTYTSTEDLTNNAGTRLPRWPLNQWSTILSYQPIESMRANLEGRFVGQRFNDTTNTQSMPSFYVWNVSATYDVNKTVQIYGRADNIFNRKYEEILFFGTPIQ